jgi:hypothetical protein
MAEPSGETPQVPTIWIANHRSDLDPAILRRMTLVIGFDRPKRAVRERIVKRRSQPSPCAGTAGGVRPCQSQDQRRRGGFGTARGQADRRRWRGGHHRHSQRDVGHGQSRVPDHADHATYDPALSRADTDLVQLGERLIAAPEKGWSLLLSGPSGTGKSAFARHLAASMGLEIEERRCSDLISPFVGQTEQNIAEAFATAAEHSALLLIDEADSFLYAREAGSAHGRSVRSTRCWCRWSTCAPLSPPPIWRTSSTRRRSAALPCGGLSGDDDSQPGPGAVQGAFRAGLADRLASA